MKSFSAIVSEAFGFIAIPKSNTVIIQEFPVLPYTDTDSVQPNPLDFDAWEADNVHTNSPYHVASMTFENGRLIKILYEKNEF